MPTIHDPILSVHHVAGHPGQRCLRVGYDLSCESTDSAVDGPVRAHIVIHAVDKRDAAIEQRKAPILEADDTFIVETGVEHRVFEQVVNCVDLDVEQDWWSSDLGGEPVPIAEWLDHISAEIRIHAAGQLVEEATTPVVTGSWGALGLE